MYALYSYGIAASPQVLLPMSLRNDMVFIPAVVGVVTNNSALRNYLVV
jgi:putative effector of murein hydrolase LrgA (UPF0299 family)